MNLWVLAVFVVSLVLASSFHAESAIAAGGCAAGTDPDGDSICGVADNCPLWANPNQTDSNGDTIGDACQCGDIDADGFVDLRDMAIMQRDLASLPPTPPPTSVTRCDLDGDQQCTAQDLTDGRNALTTGTPLATDACADWSRVVEHALDRIGYGGDPWTRQRVDAIGLEAYILEQLDPDLIADTDFDTVRIPYETGPFATWGKTIPVLESQFCQPQFAICNDRIDAPDMVAVQHGEVKFLRSIYSHRQLEAILMDFWFNHFNIDTREKIGGWASQEYEQMNLRPQMLGTFQGLLQSVTEGLAMLDYLDLRLNTATNPNENYPREIMELHTFGPVGTYDELDVQEVTRVLSGYGFNSARFFFYNAANHDNAPKTVSIDGTPVWNFDGTLGCAGQPAGSFANEGEVFICLLSEHPLTAERISRKLIQRFVADVPPESLVTQVAQTWLSNGGDLNLVMQDILLSEEFLSERYRRAKVKRPHVFAASVIRAIGQGSEGTSLLVNQAYTLENSENSYNEIMGNIGTMGEPLYKTGPPTGLPENSVAWASASGLVIRINLADRIIGNVADPLTTWGLTALSTSTEIVDALQTSLVPGGISQTTRSEIIALLDSGLPVATPIEDAIRQAASIMLSSPDFVLY